MNRAVQLRETFETIGDMEINHTVVGMCWFD